MGLRLLLVVIILAGITAKAAVPALSDFDPSYFTTTGGTVSLTNNISFNTVNVTNTLNLNNPYIPPTFTVATLPVSFAGAYAFCSDAITYNGTGGFVYYSGSQWEVDPIYHVAATNDVVNFMLDCYKRGAEATTGPTYAKMFKMISGFGAVGRGNSQIGFMLSAGTASSIDNSSATNRPYMTMDTGTTSTGSAETAGPSWFPANNDYYLQGMCVKLNTLADNTEKYWCHLGVNTASITYGTYGIHFLYDRFNDNAHGSIATNNWLFITRTNSVDNTVFDTGKTVDTSFHNFIILFHGTNSQVAYYDGVPLTTNTAVINAQRYYLNRLQITKTASSTDEQLQVAWVYNHLRLSVAPSYFPGP